MSIQISVPIKWKSKPNRTIDVLENRKFHEKSKYINDMLTPEETTSLRNDEISFHKKSGYDVDSKTSLHIKSSYKLDIFTE